MKKVIVCGGRLFGEEFQNIDGDWIIRDGYNEERELFYKTISEIPGIDLIIEGGAKGADAMAAEYARNHGIRFATVNPNWDRHGKAAGPIRNADMLDLNPTMVIAFPGGRGTANMVKQARDAGVEVIEIK